MQRPRCSAKLPKTCGWSSPITRSGSILMRAAVAAVPAGGWAPSGTEASRARVDALRQSSRRCRLIDSTPSRELLRADDSRPFADDDELAGGDGGDLLGGAAGPPDREIGGGGRAQAEVQAPVAGGVEARLGQDFLRLRAFSVACDHARADRAAVGLDALKQDLQPVAVPGDVVAQQRRRL